MAETWKSAGETAASVVERIAKRRAPRTKKLFLDAQQPVVVANGVDGADQRASADQQHGDEEDRIVAHAAAPCSERNRWPLSSRSFAYVVCRADSGRLSRTTPQYSGGMELRAFIVLTWLSST
jgi:hypothetical protein